jgi:hypothetical protein
MSKILPINYHAASKRYLLLFSFFCFQLTFPPRDGELNPQRSRANNIMLGALV